MRYHFIILINFICLIETYSQQPRLVIPFGHTAKLNKTIFSPDARFVATASDDSTAKIWFTKIGKLHFSILNHRGPVIDISFCPDSKRLISVSGDKVIICELISNPNTFSLSRRESSKRTYADDNLYHSAKFSPDGSKIIISTVFGLEVWDSKTYTLLFEKEFKKGVFGDFLYGDYSKNGKYIAAFSSKKLTVFDANSFNLLYALETDFILKHETIFSIDSNHIAYSDRNFIVKLVNLSSGETIQEFSNYKKDRNAHHKRITTIDLSFHNNKIATGSEDFTAKMWSCKTGDLLFTHKHSGDINHVVISNNGKFIVTVSSDRKGVILDSQTGKVNHLLDGHLSEIFFADISSDEKLIITGSADYSAIVWNVKNGNIISSLYINTKAMLRARFAIEKGNIELETEELSKATINNQKGKVTIFPTNERKWLRSAAGTPVVSNDQKYALTLFSMEKNSLDNRKAVIWNNDSLDVLHILKNNGSIKSLNFSPDGSKVFTATLDEIKIWDVQSGQCKYTFHHRNVRYVSFSPTGKILLTASRKKIMTWDLHNGQNVFSNNLTIQPIRSATFSSTGDSLLIVSYNDTSPVEILDALTGKSLKEIKPKYFSILQNLINCAYYINNSNWIVLLYESGFVEIKNVTNDQLSYTIKIGPDETVQDIDTTNMHVITLKNHELIQYSIKANKKILSTIIINDKEYICWNNEGYYYCSKNAAKSMNYETQDSKFISFQQLDIKFNRPDKVLEATGNKDTALIQAYHNAYLKRIDRLNIDTAKFNDDYSFPECDFNDRDSIDYNQTWGSLTLDIHSKGDKYSLERFNVWVNEVPMYGINGISLKGRNKKDFDTTITVSLSDGENRIEASVFDENATESYRSPLLVNYNNPDSSKTKTWFIGIGVNQYKNHPCRNLSFAAKDIKDLYTLFKKNTVAESYLFLDSNATREKIMKIKNTLMQSGINDKVVIALSGHGLLNKQRNFYFGTYDINFNNPGERGLSYDSLVSLLDDIPVRKKLLLIDACHSGEIDTSLHSSNSKKETVFTDCIPPDSTKKGGDPGDYIEAPVGLENSFELMKEMFVDLSRGNGAVVISAARGLGFAEEDKSWQNGAFTLCVKAAFAGNDLLPELVQNADKNGDGVSINELKEYILTNVPKITNDRQKPTTRRENIEVDWKVK